MFHESSAPPDNIVFHEICDTILNLWSDIYGTFVEFLLYLIYATRKAHGYIDSECIYGHMGMHTCANPPCLARHQNYQYRLGSRYNHTIISILFKQRFSE